MLNLIVMFSFLTSTLIMLSKMDVFFSFYFYIMMEALWWPKFVVFFTSDCLFKVFIFMKEWKDKMEGSVSLFNLVSKFFGLLWFGFCEVVYFIFNCVLLSKVPVACCISHDKYFEFNSLLKDEDYKSFKKTYMSEGSGYFLDSKEKYELVEKSKSEFLEWSVECFNNLEWASVYFDDSIESQDSFMSWSASLVFFLKSSAFKKSMFPSFKEVIKVENFLETNFKFQLAFKQMKEMYHDMKDSPTSKYNNEDITSFTITLSLYQTFLGFFYDGNGFKENLTKNCPNYCLFDYNKELRGECEFDYVSLSLGDSKGECNPNETKKCLKIVVSEFFLLEFYHFVYFEHKFK